MKRRDSFLSASNFGLPIFLRQIIETLYGRKATSCTSGSAALQ
jgi:hypothetical protein